MESIFQEKAGVDYSKLQLTAEGVYSTTRRRDGKQLLQKMLSVIGSAKRKHITDVTANVGSDTILFGLNFNIVDAIEYNNSNYTALCNNVSEYKLKNVRTHYGDSTVLFNWKTDVLYIDPPWGGPAYKDGDHIDLCIGNQRIDMWLSTILEQPWRPFYVFLKLPSNYNFLRIDALPNVITVHRFSIRKFVLVGLVISQNGTVEE
jgi:hypothetical protein